MEKAYFSDKAVESVISQLVHDKPDKEEITRRISAVNKGLCNSKMFMSIISTYVDQYKKVETDSALIAAALSQSIQMFMLGYDTCKTEKEAESLESLVHV